MSRSDLKFWRFRTENLISKKNDNCEIIFKINIYTTMPRDLFSEGCRHEVVYEGVDG